jgi:hypothetical protein
MDDKDAKDILYLLEQIQQSIRELKSKLDWIHNDLQNVQASVSNLDR